MSQILMSISAGRLHFQMINVLAQIGLTYFLCYLIMQLRFRWQVVIAAVLLVGYWGLFVAFPGTEGPFLSKTTNVGRSSTPGYSGTRTTYWTTVSFHHEHGDHPVRRVDRVAAAQPAVASGEDADPGDLGSRVPGGWVCDSSVVPDHQAHLHHVVHVAQRGVGAADRSGGEFDVHLLGGQCVGRSVRGAVGFDRSLWSRFCWRRVGCLYAPRVSRNGGGGV